MDDLNKRIMNIEIRNKKLELDKQWSNSWIRKVLIFIFTYLIAFFSLKIDSITNHYFGALVPCFGLLLSSFILKLVKIIWIKKYVSGGKL